MGLGGPDKSLGIFVGQGEVLLEGCGKCRDAAKHPVAQALGRDIAEEPFVHVEPGCRRRGEMKLEARVLGDLLLTFGCLWIVD